MNHILSLPLSVRTAAARVLAARGGVVYATRTAVHLTKPKEPHMTLRQTCRAFTTGANYAS